MQQHGILTYPEISAQSDALKAAWQQLDRQTDWVQRYLQNTGYTEVVFIGSGSSYYQSVTMAATFRKWLGRPANAAPSSDLFLLRDQLAAQTGKKLAVGVSRSGESSEVILALESLKGLADWDCCGITCHETSKLAQIADCLLSPEGKETSTVMTRSLSSMTFMMQAAIALASGKSGHIAAMEQVLQADADVVVRADEFAKTLVSENPLFHNYIYLGMGALFGIAQEACLKIKEMSYVWTESFGTLEFRHGPKSIIEKGSLVTVLVSEQTRAYELKVAQEMQEYGATILLVTAEKREDTVFADYVLEIGGAALEDEARVALYLPLVQYLGYFTALRKGVDPDHPRNLTQVVKF